MLQMAMVSLMVSFLISLVLIRASRRHAGFLMDSDSGPQKFHSLPTPRVGGIAIAAGISVALLLASARSLVSLQWVLLVIGCALPVFLSGLIEDVTKKVRPLWRLLLAFASGALAWWYLDAHLVRSDVGWLTWLLQHPELSFIGTMFAFAGISHAINIIDGYNGLAGMVSLLILGALGYVAFKVGDGPLMLLCLVAMGAVAGFLLWNYPNGLIFAGDGGAYLMGFLIALVSSLLIARHPEVSPWFPLMLVIYPAWETLFSAWRRRFRKGASAALPDALHLHQMLYRRAVRWMVGSKEAMHLTRRNSLTSLYLWMLAAFSIAPAVTWWQSTTALMICSTLFIGFYLWLYARIVRFRVPKWMLLHRPYRRAGK